MQRYEPCLEFDRGQKEWIPPHPWFAFEWEPTAFSDEILGPLGGAFHGTVVDYHSAQGFAVVSELSLATG